MAAAPSRQSGMGALPYKGGVGFRVWAKFAIAVSVGGDFNDWSKTSHHLTHEGNGYWSVDVPGVKVGQQYKFHIAGVGWRVDPYAREISLPANNCVIPSEDTLFEAPNYVTPAWNELVIYELHIESFLFDPHSYNKLGSFKSAASKLQYLAELGINAVEIMPLGQFLGDYSSGYNPSYIFAIENEWGGPDGFRKFVNEAHRVGIAVIVDVVYNHLGGADTGDMWQFDGWSQNATCPLDGASVAGGIYFYNDWRAHTNYAHTRFDYGRPEVCQYLRDNAMLWLERRFADGLRFDSVGTMRNVLDHNNDPANDLPEAWALLQRINNEIAATQPWKITIAEDEKENDAITRSTSQGGAGFAAQWGSSFLYILRDAAMGMDDGSRDLDAVRGMVLQRYNGNAFARILSTENHDAAGFKFGSGRLPSQIWPSVPYSWASKKRSTLAAAVMLTAPGIPMLFMGQEFLESIPFDGNTQLDWEKLNQHGGIHDLYRDLIHLRRNWFNNTRGLTGQGVEAYPLNGVDKVLAFHRWDRGGPGDDVVVVCNFANRGYTNYRVGFPQAGHWRVRFNSDSRVYSSDFQNWFAYDTDANGTPCDGMPVSGSIGIGPYTCLVFSQG